MKKMVFSLLKTLVFIADICSKLGHFSILQLVVRTWDSKKSLSKTDMWSVLFTMLTEQRQKSDLYF